MSKDREYIEHQFKQATQRRAEIEKKKQTLGPYSKDERLKQAFDIKLKAIKEQHEKSGKPLTEREIRKKAKEIFQHRDKRFK